MTLKTCCVLVVEDDESVRHLVTTFLRRRCSTVDSADDGEQAIALVRSKNYDAIVLDIMLPKANGFQVAEVIRTLNPQPKIIVLSAIARHFEDRFPTGTVVMQKPFELDQLANAVVGVEAPN